jgi:2-(1,2-epoxy-1,2-dihydrophenyl)acetyl-CoA isomerase
MSEPVLLRSQHDGVLTLSLNRPEKLNALNVEIVDHLIDALEFADREDAVRCVVLRGEGRGFCSGQDLDVFRSAYESRHKIEVAHHLRKTYNVLAIKLRALPKPVIASVNGIVAGVGLSVALACDMRVVADDARFTVGFSRIGLVPDGGGSYLLPLIAGFGRGLELAMTSDRFDSAEALRIGIANRVVPAADLQAATAALVEQLVAIPASALALTKHAFNRAVMPNFAAWLHEEADIQQEASENHDHREGVMAFLEKRPPAYTHAPKR